jgi:DNA polymerase III psi subunit
MKSSLSSLQIYCLQNMGITLWQRKILYDYLLMVDDELNQAQHQLIARMLQALHWPQESAKIIVWPEQDEKETFFRQKINEHQPNMVLVFGPSFSKTQPTNENPLQMQVDTKQIAIAILPTLHELLTNVSAKKQAWQIMQKLALSK